MSILAILEQRAGAWHRMSWETLAAAQQFGAELGQPVSAAVVGDDVAALAGELAAKQLERVYAVEHELLKDYTPDGYAAALAAAHRGTRNRRSCCFRTPIRCAISRPSWRPRSGRVLVSDVVAHRVESGELVLVRQLFQGKMNVGRALRGRAAVLRFDAGGRVSGGQGRGGIGAASRSSRRRFRRRRSARSRWSCSANRSAPWI